MLNLDPGKLLIVAVVAIILLGPDKLPQLARQVGGTWRAFNDFRRRMESEVRSTIPDLPSTADISRLARSPSALLHRISTMSAESDRSETGPETLSSATQSDSTMVRTTDVEGEMSWVTADYSSDPNEASARSALPAPTQDQMVVAGDAILN